MDPSVVIEVDSSHMSAQSGSSDSPDFYDAVARHALIDAMERSHRESKVITLV